MTITFASMDSWQPTALCWQSVSAHFEEQLVHVLATDETLRESTVTWAVGVLADGEWEALGAWPVAAVRPGFWRRVWEDLDDRGVDRISLVCASDLDAAHALFPRAKVLPPFWRILGQGCVPAAAGVGVLRAEARRVVREASGVHAARIALERLLTKVKAGRAAVLSPDWLEVLEQFRAFYALRPHRRAVVRAGDEYLEQLGHSLRRAVGRHDVFPDPVAATSFVAETLAHAERRLKESAIAVPEVSAHRADSSVAGLGVATRRSSALSGESSP